MDAREVAYRRQAAMAETLGAIEPLEEIDDPEIAEQVAAAKANVMDATDRARKHGEEAVKAMSENNEAAASESLHLCEYWAHKAAEFGREELKREDL